MAQPTPSSRAIARVQRLCCLGLSDQIVIPQLLRDLHDLVPCNANLFFWAGPHQELANMYSEFPGVTELTPLYLGEFHNRREREVVFTFTEVMRTNYERPADDFLGRVLKVEQREFVRGDMYNLLWRPLGWEQIMQLKVSHRGRGLGAVNLGRAPNEPEFTRRDARLLDSIAPFIAHALTNRAPAEPFVDTDDSGLVIADENGRVQYLSEAATRLLMMALYPTWSPGGRRRMHANVLPDEVVRLCRTLASQREGRPLPTPPVWRHGNPWGEFVFRLHAIERDSGPPAARFIGISIDRREPLRLKLLRRISELPLSHRESQLCLGLAAGHSRARIADEMGIREHTAITHCRNLYAKLGVHSRSELIEQLRVM